LSSLIDHFNFPGYTDGLVVVALLFFIFLMIFKTEKKMQLPQFCNSCANYGQRLFNSSYCHLKCKYNPRYEYSYSNNYYLRKKH